MIRMLLALAAALATLSLAAAAQAGVPGTPPTFCPAVKTTPTQPVHAQPRAYRVYTIGIGCAFAQRWAKILSVERVAGHGAALAHGPAGFVCKATGDRVYTAVTGICVSSGAKVAAFGWAPKTP